MPLTHRLLSGNCCLDKCTRVGSRLYDAAMTLEPFCEILDHEVCGSCDMSLLTEPAGRDMASYLSCLLASPWEVPSCRSEQMILYC